MKRIFSIFTSKHYRYLLVGSIVFLINYGIAKFVFGFSYFNQSNLYMNLGNLLATELALLISFPLHKKITWLEDWSNFFPKLLKFHFISLFGIVIRILSFSILIQLKVNWEIATFLSIVLVVIINFAGFDRFVFLSDLENIEQNENSYSKSGLGFETLETVEDAVQYNTWISTKIEDYLGIKNIEIGAGTGTIANIISEKFPLELYELSQDNQKSLKKRFKTNKNIVRIDGDLLKNTSFESYDCIYSSNVIEHIEDDLSIIDHSFKLLKHGGFFVAIVPAMPILHSKFDKKIGHFRRYSKKDKSRIEEMLKQTYSYKILEFSYFNPIGAIGWFIKMKILKKTEIKKQDAMIMNSLIPFISWMDYLPLGFGQSIIMVFKKL